MLDPRPVLYVIGLLVAILGATMVFPLAADLIDGRGHWPAFLMSGVFTVLVGGVLALSTANAVREGLTIQQTF
ncbi:potassium transporter TrkH, partial [Cribrihabitans sp. XS_ASV171]